MVYRLVHRSDSRTRRFLLDRGENLVGSHPSCEVRLDDPSVSRHHAVLVVTPEGVQVADLGSENGTCVDGSRLHGQGVLWSGSILTLGTAELRLETVDETDAEIAVRVDCPQPDAAVSHPPSTASVAPLHRFTGEFLPSILRTLGEGSSASELADEVGSALAACLPAPRIEIRGTDLAGEAVLFRLARSEAREPPVILEGGGVTLEVELLHQGAGRLHAPLLEIAHRLLLLGRERRSRVPETVPAERHREAPPLPRPTTQDPGLQAIYRRAAMVARGRIPVLIRGESGTGKELLARYLHEASAGRAGAFVTLNCAALPRDLQEAELFGVEKGVATGVEARPGKFELAHGGTLFLDEIGDMAPETQAKILRVLQEGEVFRLGGRSPRPAQARLISATHRDLDAMRRQGSFRDDLYHRIADWDVELPPLRERRCDIANLAAHFVEREAAKQERRLLGISRKALSMLETYTWPGNVRQLEREISRAVLFVADGGLLDSGLLSEQIVVAAAARKETLRELLQRTERQAIATALRATEDDVAAAARDLGLPASTLYRKLKSLGLKER